MRLKLSVLIIFALVTFGTPFAVFLAQKDTSSPTPPQTSSATSGAVDKGQQKSHTIKVLDGSTGQVQELALRDYLYLSLIHISSRSGCLFFCAAAAASRLAPGTPDHTILSYTGGDLSCRNNTKNTVWSPPSP